MNSAPAPAMRQSAASPCQCSTRQPHHPWLHGTVHQCAHRRQHHLQHQHIQQRNTAAAVTARASEPLQQPAASTSTSPASDEDDFGYMAEYAALKTQLLDNTRKSGSAIGLYLLLTVDGTAALCGMAGTAASYAYLSWLMRDVDAVTPNDLVPLWEANKIENALLRKALKVRAAYQNALRPRLLTFVALAAGIGAYNVFAPEPLPLVYQGCILGGFLSYKIALLLKVIDELMPKPGSSATAHRPVIEPVEDELDQWGRPKRKTTTSPLEVMPEEERLKAEQQLAQDLERQQRRQGNQ